MPLDFPSSPTNGQTYTFGSKTWTYNGTSWALSATTNVAVTNSAQTFTATQTIVAQNATTTPLIVKGAASQSADLLAFQDSAGTVLSRFASNGALAWSTYTASQLNSGNGSLTAITVNAGVTPITAQGTSGQTADLLSVQNSSGTVLAKVTAAGVVGIGNATTIPSTNPTGGGVLYVDTGALKYIGTSGTAATIVNADGSAGGSTFLPWTTGAYYTTSAAKAVSAGAINTLGAVPVYVPNTITATSLQIYCSSATVAGNIRLGIYNSGSNGQPSSLLLDAGTVNLTGAGIFTITISQSLSPGWYWLAGVQQSGTMNYITVQNATAQQTAPNVFTQRVSATGTVINHWYATGVSGTLPATPTWLNAVSTPVPAPQIGT